MLARSGALPTRGRWAYEVKWDGFRAIVRAGDAYRVRSRRGWDMTALVPELRALPDGVYDGELVAFDDGIPWFPDVCARLPNGDRSIRLTFMVFDVLALVSARRCGSRTSTGGGCSSSSTSVSRGRVGPASTTARRALRRRPGAWPWRG
jgi:hypothetical protein